MSKLLSTNKFIWVHTPKAAGTWLHHVLCAFAPPEWDLRGTEPGHVPLAHIPDALEAQGLRERLTLPIVATCRNPWDWHVSHYFWMEQHYQNRTGGFAPPPSEWTPGAQRWARDFSRGATITGFREALPRIIEAQSEPEETRVMCQRPYLLNADDTPGAMMMKFEDLRTAAIASFWLLAGPLPETLVRALRSEPPRNTSSHGHYSRCYDEQSRRLVADYDRAIIEAAGYDFISGS